MDCVSAVDFQVFLQAYRMVPIYIKSSSITMINAHIMTDNNQQRLVTPIDYYMYSNYGHDKLDYMHWQQMSSRRNWNLPN